MKWVRKDRHTQTEGRQTASPKAEQPGEEVSQHHQAKIKWVWRPKQVNKPQNKKTKVPKQIWVPKTQVYRCEQGFAWIRKDR